MQEQVIAPPKEINHSPNLSKEPIPQPNGTLCVVWDYEARAVTHRSRRPELARAARGPATILFFGETAEQFRGIPETVPVAAPREATRALPAPPASTLLPVAPNAARELQRAASRAFGYTGDACRHCGCFTLVRNGTCLKCNMCGETSGCS